MATGQGEMLTAITKTPGSAGYVAIERVSGTLHGRTGSFVFQHAGTMDRGGQRLSITVVPDSGTGELAGLSGTFTLDIVDGKHLYVFESSLSGVAGWPRPTGAMPRSSAPSGRRCPAPSPTCRPAW